MKVPSDIRCALLLAASAAFSGCDALPEERAAWICNALAEDNQVMLGRDAARVDAKLRTMQVDPYLWFRGTAGLFYRDLVQPERGWVFEGMRDAAATDVQLVGDAHLENIGTYLDEEGLLRLEFNDFDAAGFGAFWLEVWRLATSFALLDQRGLEAGAVDVGATWAGWVAEAYAEAVLDDPTEQTLRPVVDNGEGGALIASLFADARKKGGERDELADETIVNGPSRKFRYAAYPERQPREADLLLEPTREEMALAERVWQSISAAQGAPSGGLLGVARRQGAGVASMPNLRLYLLLDGPSERREDDLLLEVKELLDPPIWLDPRRGDDWVASEQGERVVAAQLALQGSPRADRWLGSFRDGQMAFRIRQYTDFQSGLDFEDVKSLMYREGASSQDGYLLARVAGRLLARSHMQAPLRSGGDAAAVLRAVLAPNRAAFVAQTREVAADMALQTWSDFQVFRTDGTLEACTAPWGEP